MKPARSKLVLAVSATCLLGGRALASPSYPAVLQDELNLVAPPSCLLCHTTAEGGLGTADTPFGRYLMARGARGDDEASMRTAVQAAEAEAHDADTDGVADVDELAEGDDPNRSGAARSPPSYGCSAGARGSHGMLALALYCGALTVRRRRRGLRHGRT